MQEDTTANQGPVPGARRCVVWVSPGNSAPADLLGGLSRRGVNVAVVIEPARVMVELARQTTGALIVVEPGNQPYLSELIHAVKTYYPQTARWCYQARQAPAEGQLSKLNGQADAAASRSALQGSRQADDQVQGNPLGQVHRSGLRDRVRSLVVKVESPDGLGEPLISEEELAMLLGPAPGDGGDES
jgi:hypothetical protein